jgi:flagellar P-ring protein precursor FlgI
MAILKYNLKFRVTAFALILCAMALAGAARAQMASQPPDDTSDSASIAPSLPPSSNGNPAQLAPAGGLLGYPKGAAGSEVVLATIAHIRGVRVNHLTGHGLVVGLQNTGDSQQTLFSIQFLLNTLRHEDVTLPSSLNPQNMQTRNLAAAIITVDLPAFARAGSRVDVLVSALGDARSLQGGTLMMAPLRGADGRVYALAQGPITVEGYFASAAGGASERKNFQTGGQIPGGATVEREVANDFGHNHELEVDLNDPDAGVAMRAADAITRRYQDIAVAVTDPGTLHIKLPPALSAVSFAAALNDVRIEAGESDRVVMDERTGTIVVGGAVTVGRAAVSHGNLIVTIAPTLTVSQPGPFSSGTSASLKTAKITVDQDKGEFFMLPKGASIEQIAETLNAIGTKPGDTIAIFEGLRAAGALHGELVIR